MTTRRSILQTFAAAVCAAAVEVTGLQPIPRFRAVFEAAYSVRYAYNPAIIARAIGKSGDPWPAENHAWVFDGDPLPADTDEPRFNLSDDDTWQLASPPPDDCQPNPDYYAP